MRDTLIAALIIIVALFAIASYVSLAHTSPRGMPPIVHLRAEVMDEVGVFANYIGDNEISVYIVASDHAFFIIGGQYLIRQTDSLIVLDASGENISFCDIIPGSMIDVTTRAAMALPSPPRIGAITIQLVE